VTDSSAAAQHVRDVVGAQLTDHDVEALATYYANLAQLVAAFATEELRWVEPPLRSTPGPRKSA